MRETIDLEKTAALQCHETKSKQVMIIYIYIYIYIYWLKSENVVQVDAHGEECKNRCKKSVCGTKHIV